MSESRHHFAVVGCGRIARRHAEHIHQLGELAAACDSDFEKARRLCAEFGGKAFGSLEEMLASGGIEIVSICSPNAFHAEHSVASLRAGCHVLCEKPMATTVRDCETMINAAEKSNRRLFIVKQNRFNPPVDRVKRLIDDGRLGKLLSFQISCFWNRNDAYYATSWKGTRRLDGGTLFTQFSHFVDLLYWLIGDVKHVHAMVGNLAHHGKIEIEDAGVVAVECYGNVLGTINYTVNSYGRNMEGSLTLFGDKGTVKIGGQYLNELEYCRLADSECISSSSVQTPASYTNYEGSQSRLGEVYRNMLETLADRSPIATSGLEGLKTVEIIEKIYRAATCHGNS